MAVKKGYKQTEVGVIPEDWDASKLGRLAEIRMCKRVFSNQTSQIGDIPFFKIGTFGKEPDAYISYDLYSEFRKKYSFPDKGDVLLSAAGSIGKTVVYDGDPAYFQDSNIVWLKVDSKKISNEYLYYCYQAIKWASPEGSTISRLYNGIIRETLIPLPPTLSEQTAIATALSDADALIEALEQLIAKKRHIKQGAMQELLTGKKRLPGFSGEWEVKKAKQFGDIVTGGTPSTELKEYWNGDMPWVTPTDISGVKDIYSSERHITEAGLASIRGLPSNSVLVTCIASIGKNAILRKAGACNQQINAIIPNNENDVDFLYYLMESKKKFLIGNAGITATMIISKKDFSELEFIVPSKDEQAAIATILSDMDAEIAALEEKLNKARAVKQGMMQELLTGRVRLV